MKRLFTSLFLFCAFLCCGYSDETVGSPYYEQERDHDRIVQPWDRTAYNYLSRLNTASATLTGTSSNATYKLSYDLSQIGYVYLPAVYPFIGANAASNSQNLTSSTYTVTWGGTITHDANGVTGNGSTGFGDTGLAQSVLGATGGYSVYVSGTVTAAQGYAISMRDAAVSPTVFTGLVLTAGTTNNVGGYYATVSGVSAFETAEFLGGLATVNRLSSTELRLYDDGVSVKLNATADVIGTSGGTVHLLCLYRQDTAGKSLFSANNIRFAAAHTGLSTAQVSMLATAVNTFETSIGRP